MQKHQSQLQQIHESIQVIVLANGDEKLQIKYARALLLESAELGRSSQKVGYQDNP